MIALLNCICHIIPFILFFFFCSDLSLSLFICFHSTLFTLTYVLCTVDFYLSRNSNFKPISSINCSKLKLLKVSEIFVQCKKNFKRRINSDLNYLYLSAVVN